MLLGGKNPKHRRNTRANTTAAIQSVQLSPSAVARMQADALARFHAGLAEVRRADQERFDRDGLPRFVAGPEVTR